MALLTDEGGQDVLFTIVEPSNNMLLESPGYADTLDEGPLYENIHTTATPRDGVLVEKYYR